MQHTSVETLLPELKLDDIPIGIDKEQQTKIRIGQYFSGCLCLCHMAMRVA